MAQAFRSHTCGELRPEHVGQRVTLSGWVHRRRDHGHLAFFDLRDRYGLTQVVTNQEDAPEAHAAAEPARSEWVVQVEGVVRERPEGTANAELATGAVEVAVDRFTVLNPSKVPPFYINEEQPGLDESLRLEYRYLDLRRPSVQSRMLMRSRLAGAIRRALEDDGFVEIETPNLIRSTPEGARDFVVPSRLRAGEFYALPQSPQVLKQLLMVAGYDRYYQLARAFRDEDLRGDRQPEHTQVDIEMSFVSEEDVLETVERMVTRVAKEVLPEHPLLQEPFPRIEYPDAMDRYGSDKPDVRFGMELVDLTDAVRGVDFRVFAEPIAAGGRVRGIVAPGCGGMSRRELDELTDLARRHGAGGLVHLSVEADGSLNGPAAKFLGESAGEIREALGASAGDLILIVADADAIRGAEALGHVRLEMGDRLELRTPGVLALCLDPPLPDVQVGRRRQALGRHPQPVQRPGLGGGGSAGVRSGLHSRPAVRPGPQRLGGGRRIHPHPPPRPAGARLRADGPLHGERPRPVRRPARRARIRGAATRRDRHRPGPMGSAVRGGGQHPRGDGLPQDAVRDRPDARRPVPDRRGAAGRARPSDRQARRGMITPDWWECRQAARKASCVASPASGRWPRMACANP